MESKVESTSTVLVDQYRKAAGEPSSSTANTYKGLQIHALPGLHEFTAAQALKHLKPGDSLLDLAAGSGAMSLRLRDMGFEATATDYVPENFRLHDSVPFFTANLNENFAESRPGQFDAIMASEIIEHLENPRHFARECFKLLKPGGKIILSTPNVDSPASIVNFIRSSTFQWFDDSDYKHDGHITPLSQWQIHKSFTEAGFLFRWMGSFGDEAGNLRGSPRLLLLSKLIKRLSGLTNDLGRQIFVAVLEKP
jgi:2-polyprenyl-3-methyl-5-hydroxy-6-metoxy-1,4-benzoquinol methylase